VSAKELFLRGVLYVCIAVFAFVTGNLVRNMIEWHRQDVQERAVQTAGEEQ